MSSDTQKFTKADELLVPQSVGPFTEGDGDTSKVLKVFQPHQGRNLLYTNPNYKLDPVITIDFSFEVKGDSVPNGNGSDTGPTKFVVFCNRQILGGVRNAANDYEEVSFNNVPIGRAEYGEGYVNIAITEIFPRNLSGVYDTNLYVKNIQVNNVIIPTGKTSFNDSYDYPDDVVVYYSSVTNWDEGDRYIREDGKMPWATPMYFEIPFNETYFNFDEGGNAKEDFTLYYDESPILKTTIVESLDNRIPLGTYTINNRDFWENNNFNESTFQSYLKENLEVIEHKTNVTPDGLVVRYKEDGYYYTQYDAYKYSIDALPFVVNPNNDDVIHLDRYYDKKINKEEYELATEGKINFYLSMRESGRLDKYPNYERTPNIDIFSERNRRTSPTNYGALNEDDPRYEYNTLDGTSYNRFDYLILTAQVNVETNYQENGDIYKNDGCYVFKLDWGDGTDLEYTDKPKILESTTLFEHFYEKPGFYTISGIVYQIGRGQIRNWEKFESNILLNPSPNYDINLYDFDNFASIGGINNNSTLVKSLYNIVGINPLSQSFSPDLSEENIEKLNQLDKIQILNTLGKINYNILNDNLLNVIRPYQGEIDDTDDVILGCTNETATNYNSEATIDDGSCTYEVTGKINVLGLPDGVSLLLKRNNIDVFLMNEEENEYTFDIRINQKLQVMNGLNSYNSVIGGYELQDYNDYFFMGWYDGDDLITNNPTFDEGAPNQIDLVSDFTYTAKFQYIDDTPPIEPRSNYGNGTYGLLGYDNQDNLLTFNRDVDSNGDDYVNKQGEGQPVGVLVLSKVNNSSQITNINFGDICCVWVRSLNDPEAWPDAPVNKDYETYEVQIITTINDEEQLVFEVERPATDFPSGGRPVNIIYTPENLALSYQFKVRTRDVNGLTSVWKYSDSISPSVDYSIAPDPLTFLNGEQINIGRIRYEWDQIDEGWPGIDGDFGKFVLEITSDNGEEYVYDITDIGDNFYDFEPDGSIFRYPNNGIQLFGDDIDINNDMYSWNAKIKVVDGDGNESDWISANTIQPSREVSPFATLNLEIGRNQNAGSITVNNTNFNLAPTSKILLTSFLSYDVELTGETFTRFDYWSPVGDDFDINDIENFVNYDENQNPQTISVNFSDTINNAGLDYTGFLRANFAEINPTDIIQLNTDNVQSYYVQPFDADAVNEDLTLTFDWDVSTIYDGGHLSETDVVTVSLTHLYFVGNNAVLANFLNTDTNEPLQYNLPWSEEQLSGQIEITIPYVRDGVQQLSYFSLTGTGTYPETFRFVLKKNNEWWGTSTMLNPATLYGSENFNVERAQNLPPEVQIIFEGPQGFNQSESEYVPFGNTFVYNAPFLVEDFDTNQGYAFENYLQIVGFTEGVDYTIQGQRLNWLSVEQDLVIRIYYEPTEDGGGP